MAEEQQPAQETPAGTLDDVYRKYNVEGMANEFANQVQQQPAPQVQAPVETQVAPPDPVTDPEGFKRFVSNDFQSRLALRQTLQSVSTQLNEFQQNQARAREEADIKRAVEIVNQNLKADPEWVEVALGMKARKDPNFLKLYEMRQRNPKAWEEGLKAVASEFETKHQLRADPQLAENQRAMRTAQQAMSTGTRDSTREEKLGQLPMHELDRELDKIKGIY